MKKKWILLLMMGLIGLTLSSCVLFPRKKGGVKSSSTSETFSLRGDSSSSSSADDSLVTAETKRVGSDDYGYISIPKNWVKFTDLGGGDSIQYTDGSGYNIVSMNAYTKEKANIGEGEDFTAETIANRIYYNWSENKEAEKFWGAKTTVSGNDAYQVNVNMKSGQYLTSWIFKQKDKIYLISFEGDSDTLGKFVYYIEYTWDENLEESGKSNI